MKNRSLETVLLILFLAHGLSSAGDFFVFRLSGNTRFNRNVPQEKTIPPPGANAMLDGCSIGPIHFSDGREAAVSL